MLPEKKLKALTSIALSAAILSSSASAAYLYAPDGRCEYFPSSEVEAQLSVGWYSYPVTRLYALDGRSEVFKQSEVAAQLTVGWYRYPVVLLYDDTGKTKIVRESQKDSYSGWYTYPVVKLYAPDGRTEIVPQSEVAAQLTVGWYHYPVQTLYTIDGRSSVFMKAEVEAQLTVGWYEEYTLMYDALGYSHYVHWSKLKDAHHYGYYFEPINLELVDTRDYYQKLERIFPAGRYFSIQEEAEANMVNISIPIWKMADNGTKYSSTASITVHRVVADDVYSIFTEIYNDPSQFPINSVGGFSWRNTAGGSVSQHSYGTCIDINPNENYYVSPEGEAIVGSHWTPGTDPYSISGDSVVVKAFAKYGWAWGGNAWGDWFNTDFMHFTYLGG